jgi:hypothetical protein
MAGLVPAIHVLNARPGLYAGTWITTIAIDALVGGPARPSEQANMFCEICRSLARSGFLAQPAVMLAAE